VKSLISFAISLTTLSGCGAEERLEPTLDRIASSVVVSSPLISKMSSTCYDGSEVETFAGTLAADKAHALLIGRISLEGNVPYEERTSAGTLTATARVVAFEISNSLGLAYDGAPIYLIDEATRRFTSTDGTVHEEAPCSADPSRPGAGVLARRVSSYDKQDVGLLVRRTSAKGVWLVRGIGARFEDGLQARNRVVSLEELQRPPQPVPVRSERPEVPSHDEGLPLPPDGPPLPNRP
jgi:hypothetical protein